MIYTFLLPSFSVSFSERRALTRTERCLQNALSEATKNSVRLLTSKLNSSIDQEEDRVTSDSDVDIDASVRNDTNILSFGKMQFSALNGLLHFSLVYV